ncbi:lysoplasmalogenase [Reichenbachiella carrageenanivorans]|uniref:Lysoplasmalogenase n=1 Tax=Reichenbachiella carrageenanivorans TaxID=2979869 RepID=A0ABY6D3H9_9BACT|nr:lysoplasmalogenase [Reichenbachiella carrageenanivorans]UXX78395.1 lysoplasmalogenase [Reichenbachiella carrageenanivorans]
MKDEKVAQIVKYVFIAIAIAELCSHVLEWKLLNEFTKPMLIPVLLVYLRKGMKTPVNLSFIFAVFALVFSWFGDVALMYVYKRDWYFLVGLGAFAVAQVLYFFSFKHAKTGEEKATPLLQHMMNVLPFAIFVIGLLWTLWPMLGELKMPVAVYAVLICTMALGAVYRNGRTSTDSFNQVVFGAILFILSDSLIAINKFYAPMENSAIWIMGTYILAQWNIINGLQKHYNMGASQG